MDIAINKSCFSDAISKFGFNWEEFSAINCLENHNNGDTRTNFYHQLWKASRFTVIWNEPAFPECSCQTNKFSWTPFFVCGFLSSRSLWRYIWRRLVLFCLRELRNRKFYAKVSSLLEIMIPSWESQRSVGCQNNITKWEQKKDDGIKKKKATNCKKA